MSEKDLDVVKVSLQEIEQVFGEDQAASMLGRSSHNDFGAMIDRMQQLEKHS